MKTHPMDASPTCAKWILICTLICAPTGAQAVAQTQSTPAQGSIESALAIEEPNARIAALQKFLKTNNIPEQAQTAREAIITSWAQLADGQLGENNVERAMENFRRAIAGLPERVTDRFFEETVVRIPFAMSVRGYRNEAVNLARLLEKRFAKEPPRLASLGEFYMTVEAADDAIHALETASKLAGEEARLHRLLGAAYRMGLRLDDAVAEYQLAASFDANDKRVYYELANLYRAHGAYADAIKLYRKQLEIEPKHSPSYKGMALAYLAQGDEEQMTAALNQARDLRGSAEEINGDIYLQTQMAFHFLARNKLSQAREAAEAALLVEPRYGWARIAAAEVDLASGKYFEAERNLIAARSYASFPTLYFTLGKLYLAVEDFDGAMEQFSKAFSYSPRTQFTTKLGGVFDAQADNLKELLAREHQAAIFLAEPPTTDETFKIAEALVRFNVHLRMIKTPAGPISTTAAATRASRTDKGSVKNAAQSDAETRRGQMEELDRAAMDFIEAENVRRSFRMLHIAGHLAQAGVSPGLVIELAEQALGLAEVATETDGSLREYPNYDRKGRLAIFRGRALSAKGWALFKAEKSQEAVAALTEAVKNYGPLPEGRLALWRLATVRETQGELKEALDLYIAGYEAPASGSEIDVNRAVIESLYRKINGSLDGLNRRLGLSATSSNASSGSSLSARNNPSAAKTATSSKSNARNAAAKSEPKTGDSLPEKNPQLKLSAPLMFPDVNRDASSVASPERTTDQPSTGSEPHATPAPKPAELPAVKKLNFAIPLAPSTGISAILSTFESFALRLALVEEPAPPPPAPKVHTRKRRVTVPDNQQRDL
ncbi:MAG: tetratricopeptide repeat protein [Blastocatellales bacterium]